MSPSAEMTVLIVLGERPDAHTAVLHPQLSIECYYISRYMLLYSIIKYRAENICSYLALYVQGSHQDTITSVYVSRYALCSSLSVCVLLYLTCRLFIYLFIFWVLHRNTFFIFWGEEFGVLVGAVFFSFLIINI